MFKITAIVLAGGELKSQEHDDGKAKSLVKIASKPMLEYIISALEGCPSIDLIQVVLPTSAKNEEFEKGRAKLFYADSNFIENLWLGVDDLNLDREDLILTVSSDIPLISSVGIEDFIQKCLEIGGDAFYPIMTKEDILAKYPTTKRTYVPLKDGSICGGNIILVRKRVIIDSFDYIQKLYETRKSVIGMLKVIGFMYIFKFIFRQLRVPDIEKRASMIVGADLKGVRTDYVELAIDVDKPEDLLLVEETLQGREI